MAPAPPPTPSPRTPVGCAHRLAAFLLFCAAMLVALLMAVTLYVFAARGWYVPVFTPALAALPVAALLLLATRLDGRASLFAAVLTGTLGAAILYGGYYQVGMAKLAGGPSYLLQTELLPSYIDWRMQTSGPAGIADAEWATAPSRGQLVPIVRHWLVFSLDAAAVLAICIGATTLRRRPS